MRDRDIEGLSKRWTVYEGPGVQPPYVAQLMRSRTEALSAAWLDGHGMQWIYEPKRFGTTGWLPDFWLPDVAVLIDCKGSRILPEDKELLAASADASRDLELIVATWNTGPRAWERVRPDEEAFGQNYASAHLCAVCGKWTMFWPECQFCQKDTGFILKHEGRDRVVDVHRSFRALPCRIADEYKMDVIETIGRRDLDVSVVRHTGIEGDPSYNTLDDAFSVLEGIAIRKLEKQAEENDRDEEWIASKREGRIELSEMSYLRGPDRGTDCLPLNE